MDFHKLSENKDILKKYKEYKNRAKKKNTEFSLSLYDFTIIVTNTCYSCNIEFNGIDLFGVDRLDNNKGYTILNSRTCCWDCNRSKSNKSLTEYSSYLGRFDKNTENRINELQKKIKRAEVRNIDNIVQAQNDENNTTAFFLNQNFNPQLYYIYNIETPIGMVYEKGFSIFGNIYKYMSLDNENVDDIPKELLLKLKNDSILLKNKKLITNVTSDYFFTKKYHNKVLYHRTKHNL
jgi:hypothetical protein